MTNKFQKLLLLSMPLFIVHALEEYSTGLLGLDPLFNWVTAHNLPTVTLYWIEQIVLVALLVWAIYWPKRWLVIFIGLLFVFEITHIISALRQMSYYPGLYSGMLLVIVGFFYWKESLKNYKLT